MPRKFASGAAALSLAAGMLVAGAGAADAETLRFRIEVPKQVTVSKGKYAKSCAMDVWVWGTEGPTVAYSRAYLISPKGEIGALYKKVLPGYQVGWGVGCAGTADDLGKWRVRVIAYNKKGKALGSREKHWYEKYDTVITGYNAAPEPVRKGAAIRVYGRLHRVKNLGGGYTVYPGKTVRVYFMAKGSKTWSYMGATKTAKDGRFRKNFKAKRDGKWRAYFPGTSRFDSQKSSDDFVDVR